MTIMMCLVKMRKWSKLQALAEFVKLFIYQWAKRERGRLSSSHTISRLSCNEQSEETGPIALHLTQRLDKNDLQSRTSLFKSYLTDKGAVYSNKNSVWLYHVITVESKRIFLASCQIVTPFILQSLPELLTRRDHSSKNKDRRILKHRRKNSEIDTEASETLYQTIERAKRGEQFVVKIAIVCERSILWDSFSISFRPSSLKTTGGITAMKAQLTMPLLALTLLLLLLVVTTTAMSPSDWKKSRTPDKASSPILTVCESTVPSYCRS